MNFSTILNSVKKAAKPSMPVDAYAMVNGLPSNETICDSMLEGEQDSPAVDKYMRKLSIDLGFSETESKLFW